MQGKCGMDLSGRGTYGLLTAAVTRYGEMIFSDF